MRSLTASPPKQSRSSQSPQTGQWHSYIDLPSFFCKGLHILSQSPQTGQWHSYHEPKSRQRQAVASQSPQTGQWHSYIKPRSGGNNEV